MKNISDLDEYFWEEERKKIDSTERMNWIMRNFTMYARIMRAVRRKNWLRNIPIACNFQLQCKCQELHRTVQWAEERKESVKKTIQFLQKLNFCTHNQIFFQQSENSISIDFKMFHRIHAVISEDEATRNTVIYYCIAR